MHVDALPISRAKEAHGQESVTALRGVIKASGMTTPCLRQVGDTGKKVHAQQAK
jgi:hypothetical protein